MSWLYEKKLVESRLNGRITCRRVFGRWTVLVGDAQESSGYLVDMWRDALRRLPPHAHARRILMLGLAAGSCLPSLHRRFPNADITVVEWDPAMIAIFRDFGGPAAGRPDIIEGEAGETVKRLAGPYDLIIVDLFTGPATGSPVKDPAFYARLRRLIAPTGFLIVNLFREPALAALIERDFLPPEAWSWLANTLVLSQPPLPEDYVPYRQDPDFLAREFADDRRYRFLAPHPGAMRWNHGPIWFEKWYGDAEPATEASGPKRLVLWQRGRRRAAAVGWKNAPALPPPQLTGIVTLSERWLDAWADHARRHLSRWRRAADWEIVDIDLEDFLPAYRASTVKRGIRTLYHSTLGEKTRRHGRERMRFFGARKRGSSEILAGFACLDIPESAQSVNVASFVAPAAETVSAGTGLIERWFLHGLERGLRFLDFDLFWSPGDPKGWIGFSRFKSQFGVRFVRHPRLLFRTAGSWKGIFSASLRG